MESLKATVRIERLTGKPAIFYRNGHKYMPHGLACYTREEGHSDACLSYYWNKTKPAKTEEERAACDSLVRHYADICARYDNQGLIIRSRLSDN